MVEPPVAGQAPTLELERMLEENGLFSQEASAMIETWRDSWSRDRGTKAAGCVVRMDHA